MDAVSQLETAIGAELLRARLLGRAPPRLAGRYAIDAILGRGATGLVVSARDERLRRDVALKLSLAGEEERSLDEARSLAKLHHPNVVLLFDAETSDVTFGRQKFRLLVISMQRVQGASLRVWLREQKRTPEEIVAVFIGAGTGLAAAHAENIVHRDFKPDNVLVSDGGVPQVLDFGLALTANSTRSAEEGRASNVAGTDAYMAPEARVGLASTRSDQYSFALSLAEALTSKLDRPGTAVAPGVSPDVWAAVCRASAEDPNERFRGMDALLEALRSARPAPKRRSWLGPSVLAVIVLLAAGVGVATSLRPGLWSDARTIVAGLSAAAPREAGSPLAPEPATPAVALVVDSGASGAADEATEAHAFVAPIEDPVAVGPVDAGLAVETVVTVYELETVASDDAATSQYEMIVTRSERAVLEVTMRRTRTGRSPPRPRDQRLDVDVSRTVLSPSGTLTVAARLAEADRSYVFEIPLEGGASGGHFSSTGPNGRAAGTLSVRGVSHSDPVAGHDGRRPR